MEHMQKSEISAAPCSGGDINHFTTRIGLVMSSEHYHGWKIENQHACGLAFVLYLGYRLASLSVLLSLDQHLMDGSRDSSACILVKFCSISIQVFSMTQS